MDICGFPKPVYYYWKAAWRTEPSVYIFPDWNLPKDSVGKDVVVRCYSNCDRVELLRGGKSLGSQGMPRNLFLDWRVPYSPGTLTAVGYIGGKEVARHTVQTTGSPAALQLRSDIERVAADGHSVVPVEIAVMDKSGRVVTDAEPLIRFSITGEGTLAGVANGNPASAEDNVAPLRKAFRGRCMALVRAGQRPGRITLTAQAPGLPAARFEISTLASPANGSR